MFNIDAGSYDLWRSDPEPMNSKLFSMNGIFKKVYGESLYFEEKVPLTLEGHDLCYVPSEWYYRTPHADKKLDKYLRENFGLTMGARLAKSDYTDRYVTWVKFVE